MKNKKVFLILGAALCAMFLAVTSCDDTDTPDYYNTIALVTVVPNADSTFVMNLDDATVLRPTNVKTSPFGLKEVRAIVEYTEKSPSSRELATKDVYLLQIDSIRTKEAVPSTGDDDKVYGNDPIDIVADWVSIAEDGYITLRVRTLWGTGDVKHILNLVVNDVKDGVAHLTLHHDAQGDVHGRMGDALIAFNFNRMNCFKNDMKVVLTWESFIGKKTAEFSMKMRPTEALDVTSLHNKAIR